MSRHMPLPPDLAKAFSHLRFLQYKGNREWSSECPVCHDFGHHSSSGEPDRFHMHEASAKHNAHGHCRQCGHHQWVDQDKATQQDPVKIKEEQNLRREYAAKESQRRAEQMETYAQQKVWEFYHDQLGIPQRALWEKAGIPSNFQDMWRLGYSESYSGKGFTSPALTIPYFGHDWEPTSLQFRLLNPPKPSDKYRFLMGMQQQLWLPEPERELKGVCILTEGSKKGAVTFIKVIAEAGYHDYVVVSLPAAKPRAELIDKLSEFDEIVVALDPDQYVSKSNGTGRMIPAPINNVIKKINGPLVKAARFGMKIDDAFLMKDGMTAKGFMNTIEQARQVKPRSVYA